MKAIELHATRDDSGRCVLKSPTPGWFRASIAAHSFVEPGNVLGILDVLGRPIDLVIPSGASGYVHSTGIARAVGYGDVLALLDPETDAARAAGSHAAAAPATAQGLVFRAPTSGRYYGRSSPDKPPFVTVGTELATGTTICLLEVMKTFNRVAYHGDRVRVRELLVAEGADVNAGDPLLALEAL